LQMPNPFQIRGPERELASAPILRSASSRSWRDDAGVLLLRLVLGITMVWAGLGKFHSGQFTEDQAAYLESAGVRGLVATPGIAPIRDRYDKGDVRTDSVRALNLHALTLILYACANPKAGGEYVGPNRHGTSHITAAIDETGATRRILPRVLGIGSVPVVLAWSASLIQLVGGACVLLGVFTRPACVAIAVVIIGATWMTQIGPYAVGGAPGGWLGFMPPIEDGLHPHGWKTVLWQWGLITNAAAIYLIGGGRFGVRLKQAVQKNERSEQVFM